MAFNKVPPVFKKRMTKHRSEQIIKPTTTTFNQNKATNNHKNYIDNTRLMQQKMIGGGT